MTEPISARDWSGGANNIAAKDRLPEGFVRRLVNADPTPGGKLELRAGYERVYAGTAVRGVLGLGDKLLIADGISLVEFDTLTNSSRVLRTIAGAGPFVGDELNSRLYFCTANECLEYDGATVRRWGVPDVLVQPLPSAVAGGALRAGHYQLAVTLLDADGREGGTDRPIILAVTAGKALSVNLPAPPSGGKVRLYVSPPDSTTLYAQGDYAVAGNVVVGAVRDDTVRLGTALHRAPTPGQLVAAHNGVLVVATDNALWHTAPLRPHLVDRAGDFIQYSESIGAAFSAPPFFYVSADKCYSLAGLETNAPEQRTLLDFPAAPGTAVKLPPAPGSSLKRGAWMTKYGLAISDGAGGLELVNRANFAPGLIERGAAGIVEHNGNQLVVTSAQGKYGANPLAASDYFTGEILNP